MPLNKIIEPPAFGDLEGWRKHLEELQGMPQEDYVPGEIESAKQYIKILEKQQAQGAA